MTRAPRTCPDSTIGWQLRTAHPGRCGDQPADDMREKAIEPTSLGKAASRPSATRRGSRQPASPARLSAGSRPRHTARVRAPGLDPRRTAALDPSPLPATRLRQKDCIVSRSLPSTDVDGRISEKRLFTQLGWESGTSVDIGVTNAHAVVSWRVATRRVNGIGARVDDGVRSGAAMLCFAPREQVPLVAIDVAQARSALTSRFARDRDVSPPSGPL